MTLPAKYSLIALYCILIKDIQMQILNEINNYIIITIHQENLLFYFVIWKVLKMKSYEVLQGRNTTIAFLTNSEFSFL